MICLISAFVYLTFGILSAQRATNANRINADFEDDTRSNFFHRAYDSCLIPDQIWETSGQKYVDYNAQEKKRFEDLDEETKKNGTYWTVAW